MSEGHSAGPRRRWRDALFASNRFQFFVSARFLMARPLHVSWVAIVTIPVALLVAGAMIGLSHLVYGGSILIPPPKTDLGFGFDAFNYIALAAAAVAALMPYVFLIRLFFTFYTSVSLVGVSIGGAALVTVLSVMNGFEGHLRQKILGSNAHIQITQEEGEFIEWEAIRDRVDGIGGVVASTPFATSEVVIAANNNYQNVVIKGIDVPSAIEVTELEKSLVHPDALEKLEPLVPEPDLPAPVPPDEPDPPDHPGEPAEPVLDPAPPDLDEAADPIDYSGGDDADASPATTPAGGATRRADGLTAQLAGPREGGVLSILSDDDVARPLPLPSGELVDAPGDRPPPAPPSAPPGEVLDPAPDDFADGEDVGDDPPQDFSGRDLPPRPATGTGTARISTLPGVMIGSELRKTMHLYPMQEVRLVSPMADPMNPDASGTPIPFNRDYRVAGEFYTGMYEYDLKLVYVTLESLQRFLRLGDAVDGLEVRITDPDAVDGVVAAISRELGPGYRVQGWRELNRQLFTALKLEKIAMFIVLAIIILVASFSIVGTLIMIVVEKGRQIALFKTLGASDSEVVMLFVIQGSLIGLIGSLLGVALGLGICWLLATQGFPINPDVYYISELPVDVDYPTVALVFLAGVLISVAATIYPSILAAQLRPAVGLKKA